MPVFAEDSTLRIMDKEMFPQVICKSCSVENLNINKFCGTCGTSLTPEDLYGNLYFKAGGYIPLNMFFLNSYGSAIGYGVGLNIVYKGLGIRLEFDTASLDRISPINTVVANTPVLGDWQDATSRFTITPVWVSVFANSTMKEWMGYIGVGAGVAMVREEFRGRYFFKASSTATPDWGYVSISSRDNFWALQAFIGIVKSDRIGFDVKAMYIPTQDKYIYSDIGGISTTINICF